MALRIICCLICACVSPAVFAQNAFVAPPSNLTPIADAVNVLYDPVDGSLFVDTTGNIGNIGGMTTSTLTSAGGHFDPAVAVAFRESNSHRSPIKTRRPSFLS